MENTNKQAAEGLKTKAPEKDDPVKRGQEAIAVQVLVSGKPREQAEKDQKEDAEKWRNEG
jgi:hypothetical protein